MILWVLAVPWGRAAVPAQGRGSMNCCSACDNCPSCFGGVSHGRERLVSEGNWVKEKS